MPVFLMDQIEMKDARCIPKTVGCGGRYKTSQAKLIHDRGK